MSIRLTPLNPIDAFVATCASARSSDLRRSAASVTAARVPSFAVENRICPSLFMMQANPFVPTSMPSTSSSMFSRYMPAPATATTSPSLKTGAPHMMPRRGVCASFVTGVKYGRFRIAAPRYQGRSFASRGIRLPASSYFSAGIKSACTINPDSVAT